MTLFASNPVYHPFSLPDIFMVCLALFGLFVFELIIIGVWANILRRLGYTKWWALFLVYPIFEIIFLLVIAVKQWPIESEIARLRLIAGESNDIEADIESVVTYAISQEQKRQWDRAASLYRLALEKSVNPQTKNYIEECIQRLEGNHPNCEVASDRLSSNP